ncbi:Amino-acid acetyltransferase, mitochondrial [Kickxella alabastrina]|nr:Amino-acid acetyltransferase, mitochondrial [Kickxella alabastrina]
MKTLLLSAKRLSAKQPINLRRGALFSSNSTASPQHSETNAPTNHFRHQHSEPQNVSVVPRHHRERELILSVLSTVPSPREARKFLNSVSGTETMRSQRQFEEHQAKLAATSPEAAANGLVPGEMHLGQGMREHLQLRVGDAVPQKLTALVFIDGSAGAVENTGKLLAQMQRIGVSPVVLLSSQSADAARYRDVIRCAHRLADAVESHGGRARPVNEGVFCTDSASTSAGVSVDAELVGAAIAQGQIPIISPIVADSALQLQVLADTAAAPALAFALAQCTSSQSAMPGSHGAFSLLLARLIVLGNSDGISALDGTFHRFVNLQEDYAEIREMCGQRKCLDLMRTCLGILPPTAAGIVAPAISDPSLIIKGLISERPVGTQRQGKRVEREQAKDSRPQELNNLGVPNYKPLASYPFHSTAAAVGGPRPLVTVPSPTQFTLLRHGFSIQRHTSLDTVDLPRLSALLEASFKRTLDAASYYDRLRNKTPGGIEIIVAGDYQGAVIATHEQLPGMSSYLPYLDKFAVLPSVQGTGMADIMWTQLRRACPSCMWRSRSDNGVNKWYFERSSGHCRARASQGTKWVFFWYQSSPMAAVGDGGEMLRNKRLSAEEIYAGIEVANSIEPSFV